VPSRSPASRIAFWLGLLMIVGGLGLLGYVGWQFYGTNYTSHRAQKKVTQKLTTQWEEKGRQLNQLKKLEPQYIPKGQASALIRIPRFGKSYVVPVLEGTSEDVLAQGYAHFSDSADPGGRGNYALAAHRVTHGEPLRRILELRPGDDVIVETATTTYTYELDTDPRKLTVPFTGTWVIDPLPKNPQAGGVEPAQQKGQRLITLTTCAELFHTDERTIAFGHLVGKVRKG
jgi:sortase A